MTDYRRLRLSFHRCELCGCLVTENQIEIHHVDGNRNNNSLDNLAVLCRRCHRKLTGRKRTSRKVQQNKADEERIRKPVFFMVDPLGPPVCEDCGVKITRENLGIYFHRKGGKCKPYCKLPWNDQKWNWLLSQNCVELGFL